MAWLITRECLAVSGVAGKAKREALKAATQIVHGVTNTVEFCTLARG